MTTRPAETAALQRAGTYLRGRQCPQGGFCFYRTEYVNEPNLADTYHAVAALARLDGSLPHLDRLRSFLLGFAHAEQPANLFHLTATARLLDPHYVPDDRTRARIAALSVSPAPPPASTRLGGWLVRTRHIVRVQRTFGLLPDPTAIAAQVEGLAHDGGFGPGPNLVDTCHAIEILAACGIRSERPAVSAFVDSLQSEACGFTITRNSWSPRLGVVHAGVRSCRLLGLRIRHPAHVRDFVLACQTAHGGFAGAPDALPDIELTHAAVDVLLALRQPAGRTRRRESIAGVRESRDG